MLTQIINGKILTPQGWLKDGSVLISDGKILEVTNCARQIDMHGRLHIGQDATLFQLVILTYHIDSPEAWKFTCTEVEAVILWKAPRKLSMRRWPHT